MSAQGFENGARVVLDTNVCLDVFVFASARSATLRDLLARGAVLAVTRDDCRDEWHRVLRYPALALDEARCLTLEADYDRMMSPGPWPPLATRLPRCKDADDQKFLELARDAGAVALFSRDAELLVLDRRATRAGLFRILEPAALDASD